MTKTNKNILKKLNRFCAYCGKDIKIIVHTDRSYRGGHYFGKTSIGSKKEEALLISPFDKPYSLTFPL